MHSNPCMISPVYHAVTTIHMESNRLSHEVAYVKWDPVSLDHNDPEPPKYVVEFTTRGEREGCRVEVNALRVTTENKEFAALKLEGDKEYSITVSVESPTGTILARGVQSISLPREEPVPAPQDVKVSPLTSTSLRVQWKVSNSCHLLTLTIWTEKGTHVCLLAGLSGRIVCFTLCNNPCASSNVMRL